MKGTWNYLWIWALCAALAWPGGHVQADDLYNKKPVTGETVALPSPTEIQGLAVQADFVTLKGEDDSAQLVITGEGSFDRTSLVGKASGEVVRRAQAAKKKVAVIAGRECRSVLISTPICPAAASRRRSFPSCPSTPRA